MYEPKRLQVISAFVPGNLSDFILTGHAFLEFSTVSMGLPGRLLLDSIVRLAAMSNASTKHERTRAHSFTGAKCTEHTLLKISRDGFPARPLAKRQNFPREVVKTKAAMAAVFGNERLVFLRPLRDR